MLPLAYCVIVHVIMLPLAYCVIVHIITLPGLLLLLTDSAITPLPLHQLLRSIFFNERTMAACYDEGCYGKRSAHMFLLSQWSVKR